MIQSSDYLFEKFVTDENNIFSYSVANEAAKNPGKKYNPVFLYGEVSSGKTHLLHSIMYYIQDNNPDLKVKYLSTEKFTNDLINSIRNDKMDAFRKDYRENDVYLFDDIDFIEGKEITQEELFHTFNSLYESKKQMVFTSDRHPKNISTLPQKLRSRLKSGIVCEIKSIKPEIYIQHFLENSRSLCSDLLELIKINSDNISKASNGDIRILKGIIDRIIAYYDINGTQLTPDKFKES